MRIRVGLEFGQRAGGAAALVLAQLLEAIRANLNATITGDDPEVLHDFRVAIRRSRSVQRQLGSVFPRPDLRYFRHELRWLQRCTGDTRDLDVQLAGFDDYRRMLPAARRSDLDPLLPLLAERLSGARGQMIIALRSERTEDLIREWGEFVDEMATGKRDGPRDAERPIGELAGRRIGKVYRGMVRRGGEIRMSSPPAAYHELRKSGKELRYLLELFGEPLYRADVVKPMVKSLKSLQDVLGRHQDREVQVHLLRSLLDQVSGRPGARPVSRAMDALIARLLEDGRAAREQFADRFAGFASPSQARLVEETFA